jgi:hypothetical protein
VEFTFNPILLPRFPTDEATNRMRLPAGGTHDLIERGAFRLLHQGEDPSRPDRSRIFRLSNKVRRI